jgi:tetratricopeptide (TPR) repeat protein
MLEALDRPGEAIDYYSKAIELKPRLVDAYYYRGRAHTALAEHKKALADVDACLALDPVDQRGLSLRGLLLAALGREVEAHALFDYGRFVRSFRPEPPDGFNTIDAFNSALIKHIRRRAVLEYNPERASTRGGWHSRNLLTDPHEMAAAFRSMLQRIFETFVSELPPESGHPFLDRPRGRVALVAQAQILESQGYLLSHIHQGGWVSSAYYLSVPDCVEDGSDNPGWLEFGIPTEDIKTDVKLENHRVKPEPGMAVLFPSYFFHGTRPFESESERISVGIDLIAKT